MSTPQPLTLTTLRCLTRTCSGISNTGKQNSMLVKREQGWGLWSTRPGRLERQPSGWLLPTQAPLAPQSPKPFKTLTEVEDEDSNEFDGGLGWWKRWKCHVDEYTGVAGEQMDAVEGSTEVTCIACGGWGGSVMRTNVLE
ncbi:hypothetical protein DFH08DRAFT_813276 [Mycena albidolilacea]|uniref:Uncharacterized protein n=1 Tax=Mycena albidolilacea TaxID=1033008 RepID=A0AAD6ZTU2_9AGAR|nr:hypothetical protein DFH08DRAFT_813276 [Mycena albidolilacea]